MDTAYVNRMRAPWHFAHAGDGPHVTGWHACHRGGKTFCALQQLMHHYMLMTGCYS